MLMQPVLSVIIPTRNRIPILRGSLTFLYTSTKALNIEVIVVNDGSPEIYSLKDTFPDLSIIDNPGNGVASARNAGAANASGAILLFMDDDMMITKEALQYIVEFHQTHDRAALNINWIYPHELQEELKASAFGRYLEHYGFTTLKGWNRDAMEWRDDRLFEMKTITSQNLSMRASVFRMLGGYDTVFPHAGFEDHAFSKKLEAAGISVFIEPRIITYHNEMDRVTITPWLDRRIRGGVTRKVAVELGYDELSLRYHHPKKIVLNLIGYLSPWLKTVTSGKFLNRYKAFDRLTFFIINKLLATAIYQGYTMKHEQRELPLKTRILNVLRKPLANRFGERVLRPLTSGKNADSVIGKIVPMPYLYSQPSRRTVVRNGVTLSLDISDMVDWHIYYGFNERGYDLLLRHINPSDHVMDVGANIGYVALLCAQKASGGMVYAFEPSSFNFKKCRENIALNPRSNIKVFNIGFGRIEETAYMDVVDRNNKGMNRVIRERTATSKSLDTIRITSIDQWIKENRIEKIDVLKVDVEGFEMEVLAGAAETISRFCPLLMLEIDDTYLRRFGSSAHAVFDWLKERKYVLYDMDMNHLSVSSVSEDCHMDIFAKYEG